MIGRIWAIGLNTFREAVRQKVLFILVFFTVTLILLSFILGQLSLHADAKVIKDTGLASILVFGALISIFLGIGLVFREMERRTIYTILSKPVSRAEFVIGKFVGLAFTLGVVVTAMTILLLASLSLYREAELGLLKAVILIYLELTVLTAISLVFSCYSSSFMSAIFSLSFLFIGHLTDDLADVMGPKIAKSFTSPGLETFYGSLFRGVLNGLKFFSLDHFAVSAQVVHGAPVPWAWVGNGFLYAFCWWIFLLALAIRLFARKDIQ